MIQNAFAIYGLKSQKCLQRAFCTCKQNPFRYLDHLEEIQGFKLRVGDYRIIIDVDNSNKTLNILKVGHRKNIYEK